VSQLKKKGPVKLTISDLSKRYNVTKEAVYKWIKKGVIPADMVERRFHGAAVRFCFKPEVKDMLDRVIGNKRSKHRQGAKYK